MRLTRLLCFTFGVSLALVPLAPLPAQAAIAFDAASNSAHQTTSSYSWSHTVAANANFIACGVGINDAGTAPTVTSITYASVAMTKASGTEGTGSGLRTVIYYLVAPATGSNTVAVTLSGAPTSGSATGCWSFSGVDQSSPLDIQNTAGGNSTSCSVTLTGTATGSYYVQTAANPGSTFTVGDSATQDWNNLRINTYVEAGAHKAAGGNVTPSWSVGQGGNLWRISAMSITPASAAAAAKRRVLATFRRE